MNAKELTDAIKARYTPIAFLCECEGKHPTCAAVISQPSLFAQYELLLKICNFIEKEMNATICTCSALPKSQKTPTDREAIANPNRTKL